MTTKPKAQKKNSKSKELSSAAEQNFLKARREERYDELDSLGTQEISDKAKQLDLQMRDKATSKGSEFVDAGKKQRVLQKVK